MSECNLDSFYTLESFRVLGVPKKTAPKHPTLIDRRELTVAGVSQFCQLHHAELGRAAAVTVALVPVHLIRVRWPPV